MPKTRLGKWSIGLIITFFLLLLVGSNLAKTYGGAGQTFFSNPIISIPMLSAGIAGIAAFFTGIISIWKHRERSILVFVATAIGLLVIWFVLGEILSPH